MNNKFGGIAAIAGTVIGLFLMLRVWSILGMIVYLITFGLSLFKLKHNVSYEGTFNIIVFLKRINKDTFLQEGIFAIIVAIIPIVICIFLYSFIILDSVRSAEFITSKIFG